MKKGLGTQLRHIIELLDGAVSASYEEAGLNYRPRFTPVMKALIKLEQCTINELAQYAGITQPAATQTIKLMHKAELIEIQKSEEDNRKRMISLSTYGQSIIPKLEECWLATSLAAMSIDKDVGFCLSEQLETVINALSITNFQERIRAASANQSI